MLALIDMHDNANDLPEAEAADLQTAAEKAGQLFDDLESAIYDPKLRRYDSILLSYFSQMLTYLDFGKKHV